MTNVERMLYVKTLHRIFRIILVLKNYIEMLEKEMNLLEKSTSEDVQLDMFKSND